MEREDFRLPGSESGSNSHLKHLRILILFGFAAALFAQSAVRQPGWFDQERRKVHILYVSPEWAKERARSFDAEAYTEQLVRSGVRTIELYSKDHHGYVYFKGASGRQYPRDVIGEMVAACHRRGIHVIAPRLPGGAGCLAGCEL